MAFNPALPQTSAPIASAELRDQLNGLKEFFDDRPDFGQPLYRPLGTAHTEDGRWVWTDPFAEVVLASP